MNIKLILTASGAALLAACASSTDTIEKRLINIGLDDRLSGCVADDLEGRLDRGQLSDFASFLTTVDRAETPRQAIGSLRQIDDPVIGSAVAAAGVACILPG
ncbi:MAG: hypothetical protein AAF225_09825 [Pseudomonadota bacterium]